MAFRTKINRILSSYVVELNKPGSVREVLYEFQPSFYIYILHLFI